MTTHQSVSNNFPCSKESSSFQHFVGGFVIDAPCIFTENKAVFVQDNYELLDFLDNGNLDVHSVKFFHAYLKGYNVTIVVLDLETGELLKRSHRLNNDSLPCNWVLIEYNYFDKQPESKEILLKDFRERH